MKHFTSFSALLLSFRSLSALLIILVFSAGPVLSQNVGIGTATPLEKLHVIGNVRSSTLAGAGSRMVLSDLNGTLINATGATSPSWMITGNSNIVASTNFLGTTNNVDLRFRTNNLNRVTITGAGFLGLNGVVAPVCPVNFVAGNSGGLWLTQWDHTGTTDAAGRFQHTLNTNGNRVLMGTTNFDGTATIASAVIGISLNTTATGSGGVGVTGSANNESGMAVQGTLFFSGPYTGWAGYFNADVFCGGTYFGSDKRLKRDIRSIDNALSIIDHISPVSYYYDTDKFPGIGFDENRKTFGFIAQDLEQVMPELVKEKLIDLRANEIKTADMATEHETGLYKVVNYTQLIPVLTQAIKEQQEMINSLNLEVNNLKKMIQDLQTKQ
jgi:hypothetical protein